MTCCAPLRIERLVYEPETVAYMNAGNIPNDDSATVYSGLTGSQLWREMDNWLLDVKDIFSLSIGISSLSNQFIFLYPRVGGTANTHKYNLVDAVAGTFNGGWTHNASGALPNGTNGYFATGHLFNEFSANDMSFGIDSKTNTDGLYADFGCLDGNGNLLMYSRFGGSIYTRLNSAANDTTVISDSLGLLSISRTSGTSYKIYKDGSVFATLAVNSSVPNSREIVEAAVNNTGSIIQYSPRKRTLFFGGKSMTDQQESDFFTAWDAFEAILGR